MKEFDAVIKAPNREAVIRELKWFLSQLKEEADGGGTDNIYSGVESSWRMKSVIKCEKCGKDIEPARLKALPTASLCVSCSKLAKKK